MCKVTNNFYLLVLYFIFFIYLCSDFNNNAMQNLFKTAFLCCMLTAGCLFVACEKMVIDDQNQTTVTNGQANVIIHVTDMDAGWNNMTSRAKVNISEVCSRLCFAVYQGDSRVKYENQKNSDDGFGTFALKLDEGTYTLLVVGHSGSANPSTTNPAKVQFSNPSSSGGTGFTDTFYYYGSLTIGSDGANVDISMRRATAMFRLKTNDSKPDNVVKFQFYYEGGSGALDATTGFGCVNSKQSVFVDAAESGQLQFEMYTFPHEDPDEVTFTVKAFDASDNILYTKEFKNVKMQRNCITQYSGNFFTTTEDIPDDPVTPQPSEPSSYVVMVDPEWSEIFEYTY